MFWGICNVDEAANQKDIAKSKRVKMLQILSLVVGILLLVFSIISLRGEATHLCNERTIQAPTCEQKEKIKDKIRSFCASYLSSISALILDYTINLV